MTKRLGLLLALVLLPALAVAEPLLVVRGDGQYPPNEMVVDGKLQGIHIEIVRAAAEQLGIEIRFMSVPWKRALQMVEHGQADAITYIGRSAERAAFTEFIEGNILSHTENAFIVWKDRASRLGYDGDLASLAGYRIGTLRGYFYGDRFATASFKENRRVDDMAQLLQLLQRQRIDLAVVNTTDFMFQFGDDPLFPRIEILQPPIAKTANYLGFSKTKSPSTYRQTAQAFAKAISAFKKTERYSTILNDNRVQ